MGGLHDPPALWTLARMRCDQIATALSDALETAGVTFVDQNGGGPSVRLAKAQP